MAARHPDQTAKENHERQNAREDRAVDEEIGDIHITIRLPVAGL
jgi:hypothetical protein